MSGGGNGGGSQSTVQSVQIPEYEQQFSSENQDLARSLGAQPYPVYQGQLVAGFTPQQNAGMSMAGQASTAYQPDLGAAESSAVNALSMNPMAHGMPMVGAGAGSIGTGMGINPADPNTIGQYMSPYVAQALAPQITALQTQLGQQQNAINAQATGAGAFGDARHGVESALNNFYGNQSLSGLVGQGYNTAFGNALNTALGEQQTLGQLGTQMGQLGLGSIGAGQQEQNIGLNGAQALGNLGGLQQSLGISGANALYNAGQQQQTLQQQALNTAYQSFLNQSNWPFQMLNMRESALSNSPYNRVDALTLPNANMGATTAGGALNIPGLLGALSGGNGNAPFGGARFPG